MPPTERAATADLDLPDLSWLERRLSAEGQRTAHDPSLPDLAWRSYSGWAMLPSFGLCILLSVLLLSGDWLISELRSTYRAAGPLVLTLIAAIWVFQLIRWTYRRITYTYRLTPRTLFVDRGFLYAPEPPVDLGTVTEVQWGRNAIQRLVGVGWVRLIREKGEPITLTGLWHPARFAADLQGLARQIREGPNKGGRA